MITRDQSQLSPLLIRRLTSTILNQFSPEFLYNNATKYAYIKHKEENYVNSKIQLKSCSSAQMNAVEGSVRLELAMKRNVV